MKTPDEIKINTSEIQRIREELIQPCRVCEIDGCARWTHKEVMAIKLEMLNLGISLGVEEGKKQKIKKGFIWNLTDDEYLEDLGIARKEEYNKACEDILIEGEKHNDLDLITFTDLKNIIRKLQEEKQ